MGDAAEGCFYLKLPTVIQIHLSSALGCLWLQTVIVVGCLSAVGSHDRHGSPQLTCGLSR